MLVAAATPEATAQDKLPIRDNSFLIEEAFNQEKGVVQHINNLLADSRFQHLAYTFTQEWPICSEKHQLSYTIPFLFSDDDFRAGDIFVNYRYQLVQQNHVYLAPRLSAILPTGEGKDGNKGTGFQVNIPFSYEWKSRLAFHLNAGSTHFWREGETKAEYTMLSNFGGSAIWLLHHYINLMSEVLYASAYTGSGTSAEKSETLILNPGIRGAINFKKGLQIVPGFSTWFDVINHENGFLFYLSLEHPFTKQR